MENAQLKEVLRNISQYKDPRAYKELFFSFYKELSRFAYSILKSREDAEDVVSECFIHFWQKKEALTEIENPKLYFYVSVKNRSINKISARKRQSSAFNEEYLVHFKSPFFNPGELLLSHESVAKIMEAINELPPKCKLIFRLIREDGLKYADVAALLRAAAGVREPVRRADSQYTFRGKDALGVDSAGIVGADPQAGLYMAVLCSGEVDLAEDLLAALRGGTNPAMLPLRHAVRGSLEPRFIPAAP